MWLNKKIDLSKAVLEVFYFQDCLPREYPSTEFVSIKHSFFSIQGSIRRSTSVWPFWEAFNFLDCLLRVHFKNIFLQYVVIKFKIMTHITAYIHNHMLK